MQSVESPATTTLAIEASKTQNCSVLILPDALSWRYAQLVLGPDVMNSAWLAGLDTHPICFRSQDKYDGQVRYGEATQPASAVGGAVGVQRASTRWYSLDPWMALQRAVAKCVRRGSSRGGGGGGVGKAKPAKPAREAGCWAITWEVRWGCVWVAVLTGWGCGPGRIDGLRMGGPHRQPVNTATPRPRILYKPSLIHSSAPRKQLATFPFQYLRR
ncbi:hypothetical protein VC83_00163 [Pseudogymnoascus destructans]|uniref:Uncharacterized protein n=1 Tax=Pseudogymnoascus destructans TaxID=655981 RepID=A0A177AP96_9PEZI|nr:uncharacterized protein VC83_00163 [Pseudogymnoascus destructans]OAF63014.1 hypothetical protein VC83_00163 [Pseudogymnoascus destructans]